MATTCDQCGHRDNEVKSSGAIEPKGKRMDLTIRTSFDLSRDILKVYVFFVFFFNYSFSFLN